MKFLFVLFVITSLSASAQDCQLKKTQDPYTKEIKVSTGFIPLTDGKVSIMATKTEIDFLFIVAGEKCYDDASTAAVFYDGLKLKTNVRNGGPDNCDGIFHFTFRNAAGMPSALQNISGKKLSSIKFKDNTGKEAEVKFNAEQQANFSHYITCILAEAKALLQ